MATAIVLSMALLMPYAIKIAHAFESHQHEVCTTPQSSHYHQLDWDCEFYKFKLNTQYYSSITPIEITKVVKPCDIVSTIYHFERQAHHFRKSQRGPPVFV
ncbi:MAG: hypothetical protein KJO41_10785 [Bacteroidia bacterium]|nr:hypothetical protein [Bacteroidia bacterium]NND25593.1 hypothetical protein [Flavobacteriaceae bacterium]MBT8279479.1 hypothetical protein [Bacteroidia bacterium]NNK60207.1 hypothetical protein [Flavobacteriaceae bacterium]NNL33001.1 hypothetical protein [Flavobacteriaceae bacterium]